MTKICIILSLLINILYADANKAFVNIISNAEKAEIFLDGKKIGTTPIKQYEVKPNTSIVLDAVADKNYYKKDIKTTIKVNSETIPTINVKFQKAEAEIFLVGAKAELYIDDKFIKILQDTNRVVQLEANKNTKIKLIDGDSRLEMVKDIKANTLNTIKYELITIPKDIRLYTVTINDLMWEDTKEAANTNVNWEDANRYCENLEIAHYNDFRLPTIEELQELYDNKDEIYNGYGGKFYWSDVTFTSEKKIWDYSQVKNFDDGLEKRSVKEFEEGRVRCVRGVDLDEIK